MFESSHKLDFEIAHWNPANNVNLPAELREMLTRHKSIFQNVNAFRVGTCHGNYSWDDNSYTIITVINDEIGNGHLNDVLEWFENSCKRDGKTLKVAELWNDKFKKHLIEKRGFKDIGNNWVEKPIRICKHVFPTMPNTFSFMGRGVCLTCGFNDY